LASFSLAICQNKELQQHCNCLQRPMVFHSWHTCMQVYKAVLRETGENVAVKVQRPMVEPRIVRDLFIFRFIANVINPIAKRRLGCNAALIVDEFGEKLMEELDYSLEAQNIQDFYNNFKGDPVVKIPWVNHSLSGRTCLVMEWIDGIRCTEPAAIHASRAIQVTDFIERGVVSGLRQLLEFGLFHGDPHPGNIFAMPDGRIAYVDFGNVAQLSQYNKQVRAQRKRALPCGMCGACASSALAAMHGAYMQGHRVPACARQRAVSAQRMHGQARCVCAAHACMGASACMAKCGVPARVRAHGVCRCSSTQWFTL
jgi:serine/threonine protein kinase